MIPDRKIAERFSLGPTKASYAICYGLAPFYKDKIMKQLTPKDTEPPYFVWCFDEAFNVVSNRNSFMCIGFTLMNTCKEHRDGVSILNLWVMHEHLT